MHVGFSVTTQMLLASFTQANISPNPHWYESTLGRFEPTMCEQKKFQKHSTDQRFTGGIHRAIIEGTKEDTGPNHPAAKDPRSYSDQFLTMFNPAGTLSVLAERLLERAHERLRKPGQLRARSWPEPFLTRWQWETLELPPKNEGCSRCATLSYFQRRKTHQEEMEDGQDGDMSFLQHVKEDRLYRQRNNIKREPVVLDTADKVQDGQDGKLHLDNTFLAKPCHLAVSPSRIAHPYKSNFKLTSHAGVPSPARVLPWPQGTALRKSGLPVPLRRTGSVKSVSDDSVQQLAETSPRANTTRRTVVGMGGAAMTGSLLPATPPVLAETAARVGEPLVLPRLGFGAWSWGDSLFWGYDPKNDDELAKVFDYAVSKGVNLFDTAEVYGFGRSETLLGQFANRSPASEKIKVATKFAAYPWRTKPGEVLDAAKASTDRLGRPIDLYQIHFPNGWANEAYWDGLGDAVTGGLVKAVGVSNYGADALRACHAKLKDRGIKLTSNQIQVSLIYPFALENGLVDACQELGVNVLAYSPLGLGLLTGKFSEDKLPDGPRQALAKQFLADPNFGGLIATMRDVGKDKLPGGATPSQVALAWCMAKGACVIPGARTLKQAESNIGALDVKLSAEDVALLDMTAAKVKKVLTPETNPFAKKDLFTGMKMYDS